MAHVLTVGVFDILHNGHLDLLDYCYDLAHDNSWYHTSKSIHVLIDSDRRVKELKGPNRPINSIDFRCRMLKSMRGVFSVRIFDSLEEKEHLIKEIKPDVFVKGGDYTLDKILEKDLIESLGGKVVVCPYKEGFSTSNIIEKIRKQ